MPLFRPLLQTCLWMFIHVRICVKIALFINCVEIKSLLVTYFMRYTANQQDGNGRIDSLSDFDQLAKIYFASFYNTLFAVTNCIHILATDECIKMFAIWSNFTTILYLIYWFSKSVLFLKHITKIFIRITLSD